VNAARAARDAAQEQLRVAEANRDTAQSQVDLAETNFERAEFLLEAGAIGEFDYDRAAQDLEAKRNSLTAANDQVSAAQAAIAQAEATIAQTQGQADSARVNVGFQQITAPIAGTLGNIPVKVGDLVTNGQVVTQVAQNNTLDLNISIPSNRSGQLRSGLTVELFDPNTNEQLGTGEINFISPTVDPTAQVILSKARFSNPTGILRDGQYVRARVIWDTQPGVLVPTVAIARQSGREFVYLVDEDTTESGEAQEIVRFSPVELGDLQGSSFQVIEGLEEGDRVAVTNILRLRDGSPVLLEE
jgi:RND family efflux transporter MFP subunit